MNKEYLDVFVDKLKKKNKTLAIAESLTGGAISAAIVECPDVSSFFRGGVVAYDNQMKVDFLKVNLETLKKHGAVSLEVAKEMVQGLENDFKVDVAISTTGIAGPKGATKDKPVGLVFAGFMIDDKITVSKFNFQGSRKDIIEQTVKEVLRQASELI